MRTVSLKCSPLPPSQGCLRGHTICRVFGDGGIKRENASTLNLGAFLGDITQITSKVSGDEEDKGNLTQP